VSNRTLQKNICLKNQSQSDIIANASGFSYKVSFSYLSSYKIRMNGQNLVRMKSMKF